MLTFFQIDAAFLQAVFYRGHGHDTEGTSGIDPDSQVLQFNSLEDFWAKMGAFPKPGGEVHEKHFSHFVSCC